MKYLYKGLVFEARNLNRISNYMNPDKRKSTLSTEAPLKDADVVTVYHGIAYLHDVPKILSNGVDGTVPIQRKDKYENLDNPRGLFVTPTLKTAQYFANSGYVIEFNCRVSDLESPIWSEGEPLDRENKRIQMREKASKSMEDFVVNADRPELAKIFSKSIEPQALFIGKLQPNQIDYRSSGNTLSFSQKSLRTFDEM